MVCKKMSYAMHLIAIAFLHLSCAPIGGSDLTTSSDVNKFALVGSTVTFNCRTDSQTEKIRWNFYPGHSSTVPVRIHTGQSLMEPFSETHDESFDKARRHSDFTIKRVQRNNTGMYSCFETKSLEDRIDFRLNVLESLDEIATARPTQATSYIGGHVIADTGSNSPATNGDSYKVIGAIGTVGVLILCLLIVMILVFVVMKLRQAAGIAANDGNGIIGRRQQQDPRGRVSKPGHTIRAVTPELPLEDLGPLDALPAGRRSNQSSVNGHYSEIVEVETVEATAAADVLPNPDIPVMETSANVGTYQVLDPEAVAQLRAAARQPSVYVNITPGVRR